MLPTPKPSAKRQARRPVTSISGLSLINMLARNKIHTTAFTQLGAYVLVMDCLVPVGTVPLVPGDHRLGARGSGYRHRTKTRYLLVLAGSGERVGLAGRETGPRDYRRLDPISLGLPNGVTARGR